MGIFRQFPYSNFHEMNLDEILKIVDQLQQEWAETSSEWASYKDFIDNYFENLDVSEEVLRALRIMAADGTLTETISPVISETTTDWLEQNITVTEGETVIDASLSIEGAAADAAAAGNYLRSLDGVVVNSLGEEVPWEIGRDDWGQRWGDGGVSSNAEVDCTKYIDVTKYKYLKYMAFCSTANSTNLGIAFFTDKVETTYISGVAGYDHSPIITMKEQWAEVPDNAVYARFTVVKNSETFYVLGFSSVSDEFAAMEAKQDPEYTGNVFVSGAINVTGSVNTTNDTRIRTFDLNTPQIQKGDYVYFGGDYAGRTAIYSTNDYREANFVKWLDSGFVTGFEFFPDDCEGLYPGLLIRRIGMENDDISAYVSDVPDHVKYYRKTRNVLSGKKLSVMGDSISALKGHVPTGYDFYYSGTNHGITSPNEMWWNVLATLLGLDICVINAYSGSGVTQLEDADHVDKIPMSDDSRTSALSTVSDDPDIIIIAGGLNDYSYSESAQSEPLEWDGKTAAVAGNSFTEAYAYMVKKIQQNYPDAIVIALSTFFSMRGSDNGYTLTHTSGANTYNQNDYDNAIKNVCQQMHIPYIDISNIGFNRHNYYPDFAEDSSTIPTHPNAAGHRVIGMAVAEKIKTLITAFEFK